MSSAFPCGIPSTMSTSTTSQMSLSASRCAVVAPTFPAPMTVTFARLIPLPPPYMFSMTASPNSLHFTSLTPVAPSAFIRRAKS